jgi:tetratricopeptide (TPR) repeat protein
MQSEFYGQLGEAYFGLEQFIEGKTNYELALNFNQNSTLNLNNFAYRLAMANIDLERAEELIKRVNTISPNQPHFLDTYGWILFQQKKYEEAKQFFEKAYDRNSKDAVIVEHVGDINYKLGLIDQALIFWLKAKELGSTNRVLNDKIENKTYYDPKY